MTKKTWGADVTPWRELETLGDRMRRWVDYPAFGRPLWESPLFSEAVEWLPAVELVEEDGEFVLTAELPGMARGDVDVSVEDSVLTLKGEKKSESEREEQRGRLHIRERQYGSFERSFTLPRNVDAEKIKADFHDGVVEVHIPKGEKAQSRHIEIK